MTDSRTFCLAVDISLMDIIAEIVFPIRVSYVCINDYFQYTGQTVHIIILKLTNLQQQNYPIDLHSPPFKAKQPQGFVHFFPSNIHPDKTIFQKI